MTVQIEYAPDMPVIMLKAVNPVRLPDDPDTLLDAVVDFKYATGGHIFRLFDASASDWMVTDMVMSMAIDTGQEGAADDPEVTTLIVASDALDVEGEEWLLDRIDHYDLDAHLFFCCEDALAFVRQAVA